MNVVARFFAADRRWASAGLAMVALFGMSAAARAGEAAFRWVDDAQAGTCDLMLGEQPVLRYMHAFDDSTKEKAHDTYKVYHHVFGPGTKTIITKGPGGLYTHHRGLYVGWNKTSAAGKMHDFWHCTNGDHLKHAKFIEKKGDAEHGTMTAEIHWNDKEGNPVIVETRTVTARKLPIYGSPGYGWQIDWKTKLESRRGEITLSGDRQHAGFQFRAAQDVAEKNSARYLRADGAPQQPEAVQVGDAGDPPPHSNIPWVAMTYPLADQKYTIEYFEDPSLPKPSLFSERPYGRFGAFFKATLTEDKPLTMTYRVNVLPGEPPTRTAIQQRFDLFAKSLK